MDPNRDPGLSCATQIDDCLKAYTDYHSMIDTKFSSEFMQSGGRKVYSKALVLDIHGQTHVENWIELGYILSAAQLNQPTLNPSTMKSSISNAISRSRYNMDEVVRGTIKDVVFYLNQVYMDN